MKKLFIGIGIVVLVGVFITFSLVKNSDGAFGGGPRYDVNVRTIESGDISAYISSSGFIEPIHKVEGYFDLQLKVKKLLFLENQRVKKGDRIIELDTDSLLLELEQLKISKEIQEVNLKKIKGNNSIKSLENEVKISENNLKSAENTFAENKKTYENNLALFNAASISKSELDASQKVMEDSRIALKNSQLNYENAKTNYSKGMESESIEYQTEVKNLESINLKISDLTNKIKRINESTISPIDGIVTEITVKEGSFTNATVPSYTILDVDKIQVNANVSEYNIRDVKIGQEVDITGESFTDDEIVKGHINDISPIAVSNQTSSGTETVINVIISIDEKKDYLKPGLNVDCNIHTIEKKGVIIAGFDMLTEDKDGNKYVFVVDQDKKIIQKRDVEVGTYSEMNVEIINGLKENEVVVVDPQPVLKDGAKIRITNSEVKK